jgi:hypothetical protein
MGRHEEVPMLIADEQAPAQPDAPTTVAPPMFSAWARAVGLAWAVGLPVGVALEPAPAQPDAVPSVLATLLSVSLLGLLALTAAGLVRGDRWGYAASGAASLLFAGMAVACPITGHHGMGMWWFGQFAIAVGLMAVSLIGWQRSGEVNARR